MNTLEFRNRKYKLWLYLLSSLMFVIGGVIIIFVQDFNSNPVVVIFAYVGIVFFGFGIFIFSKYLFINKPALVLDNEGLVDNSSWMSVGRIEWNQIKDIKIFEEVLSKRKRIKFISIDLIDNNKFFNEINPMIRFLQKMGKVFAPYQINISTQLMNIDANELIEIMNKYKDNSIKNQDDFGV